MDEPFAMDISTPNGAFVVVGAVLVGYLREDFQAIKLSISGILSDSPVERGWKSSAPSTKTGRFCIKQINTVVKLFQMQVHTSY